MSRILKSFINLGLKSVRSNEVSYPVVCTASWVSITTNNVHSNIGLPNVIVSRNYAKGKDRGGKEKKKLKIEVNPLQMAELIPVNKLKELCDKEIEKLKEEYVKNLSLRSTSGSVETLIVKHDGKDYELQELAQIIRKNPKTMVVNMSSFPQAIPDVMKSIQSSGLNLNPQQDGTTLFIPVPKVTKEHREFLAKNAKMLYVKHRDHIKDIQNDFIKQIKKQTGVSQDLQYSVQQQLSTLCEKYQFQIRDLYNAKTKELLG